MLQLKYKDIDKLILHIDKGYYVSKGHERKVNLVEERLQQEKSCEVDVVT